MNGAVVLYSTLEFYLIETFMTEILLIRHAVNDWVKTGRLAGWTPGVHLNEEGHAQAKAVGEKLAHTSLVALYASPLERTVETAEAIAAHPRISPCSAWKQWEKFATATGRAKN